MIKNIFFSKKKRYRVEHTGVGKLDEIAETGVKSTGTILYKLTIASINKILATRTTTTLY